MIAGLSLVAAGKCQAGSQINVPGFDSQQNPNTNIPCRGTSDKPNGTILVLTADYGDYVTVSTAGAMVMNGAWSSNIAKPQTGWTNNSHVYIRLWDGATELHNTRVRVGDPP
jgi:hypothetical protein